MSPVTSKIEDVCEQWITELLNNLGYDAAKKGLFNARGFMWMMPLDYGLH